MTKPTNETVLVIGATSSLAQAICRALAARGYALMLGGRDADELSLLASDIHARFSVETHVVQFDFMAHDFSSHALIENAGYFDHAIIATGEMGSEDPEDISNLAITAHLNYVLPAEIATLAAQKCAQKQSGNIVIISSVAGDRGRQSNYAYGSAKAALTAFASGLRNRFFARGVHVMTVKPGFIDTPMTWGMQSPLIASREFVAEKIVQAMEKKKDVIYVPFFWQFIMLIIRHIPERVFKKLKL
ncbi:MAG: SDR family NAD(P)-dependent oxidoreductase [Alphaproteobacteria bacterium]|nr:SDR family NAD(P)-dependent oxidoreductase [Alphaproteobacteria bacterium]